METIIIQEADMALRDVLTIALEAEGFNALVTADSGSKFLGLLDRVKPGLVVLDFIITGASCISMCKQIKSSFPKLPVLAMSCNIGISEFYHKFGFNGYISKPFDLDVLFGTLREYFLPAGHARLVG